MASFLSAADQTAFSLANVQAALANAKRVTHSMYERVEKQQLQRAKEEEEEEARVAVRGVSSTPEAKSVGNEASASAASVLAATAELRQQLLEARKEKAEIQGRFEQVMAERQELKQLLDATRAEAMTLCESLQLQKGAALAAVQTAEEQGRELMEVKTQVKNLEEGVTLAVEEVGRTSSRLNTFASTIERELELTKRELHAARELADLNRAQTEQRHTRDEATHAQLAELQGIICSQQIRVETVEHQKSMLEASTKELQRRLADSTEEITQLSSQFALSQENLHKIQTISAAHHPDRTTAWEEKE